MIRSMVLELTSGLMGDATLDNGLMESNMEKAASYFPMELRGQANGRMGKE